MTMYTEPVQNNSSNTQSAASMLGGLNSFYGAPATPPAPTGNSSNTSAFDTGFASPNSGGYSYNNQGFAFPSQQAFAPINAPLNMGQAYNQSIDLANQYKQSGNPWNQQGLQYVFGQMGLPSQVANQLWQDAQTGGFPSEQTWATDLQNAVNQYNTQGEQAQAQQQNAPGNFFPNNTPPPWLTQWLTSNGWTAPAGGTGGTPGTAPTTGTTQPAASPMSTGAPPWAQALQGGYALPQSIAQPSIPFASAQQWNSFLPQEQQAILGTAQSVGIDPAAYQQQMFAGFPEWGAIGPSSIQSY